MTREATIMRSLYTATRRFPPLATTRESPQTAKKRTSITKKQKKNPISNIIIIKSNLTLRQALIYYILTGKQIGNNIKFNEIIFLFR